MTSTLRDELKKRGPFASIEQEAMLAILRTSDLLENRMARLMREYGLTLSQYNVLRILRGEGKPMPCLEIAERMIQVAPAITRVIDQLLALDLITKTQSEVDRRIFVVEPKPAALQLLNRLDQPVLDLHALLMKGVSKSQLTVLVQTLDAIRGAIPG
ncbi:MarR family winged helix-turn-helix transcriptional regulator [Schlesneria sp. T3-172]|uniref:MarR family winged helix-turn-helix transcriptional regulator n=1 Tax=Schlesneria sphaerica TaxID=3373610 RepID=UPI0037CC3961